MGATAPRRSERTRAAILAAARDRFAAEGFERATIRAIAADAGIDPSMVMRYYGSKDRLFAAAAEFRLRLPDLASAPRRQVGRVLAEHFLERWEEDEALVVLLRASASNAAAVQRVRRIFAEQLVPAVAALHPPGTPPGQVAERAALVGTQVLGAALCRYVLSLAPVATMDRATLVGWLGPTLQRYLVGEPACPARPSS
jgi:AcrR family transcriptional regulator